MNKIAACIGGGVIGGGWVARFLYTAGMSACLIRHRMPSAKLTK
ncbi:hypothetical protein [Aliamphritea spongicola]|nr:hypothetical protein [Aliamphritea spongicola]